LEVKFKHVMEELLLERKYHCGLLCWLRGDQSDHLTNGGRIQNHFAFN